MHIKTTYTRLALLAALLLNGIYASAAADSTLYKKIDAQAQKIAPDVIAWRRHIHQHPELGNREFKTAEYIAAHLRALGFEVKTGVGHTGVVALLKGDKPGPVVGLRSEIDALPITEENDLSFRSVDSTLYKGVMTGVMHACGHDSHIAMLLGAADILAGMKHELKGTVKFIFQPSEEGPPDGEEGGAKFMVKEGVLDNPKVDVIFGQHISSGNPVGTFIFKPGSVSAENDIFRITIHGKQSHGAAPWASVDPIVTASQVVLGLQTIISRNTQLTSYPAVLTVGSIHAGNRQNIIPSEAVLTGTIRTLDTAMRNHIQKRLREVVTNIAASAGATADVDISMEDAMLVNDSALTKQMAPVLAQVAAGHTVLNDHAGMGAEDFAYYAQKVPGFYFTTGAMPKDKALAGLDVGAHTPHFLIDESAFVYGVRAMCYLTIQYMQSR